jgi:hypothetical protein
MAKPILMDEIHVTLFAPHGLREEEYDAIYGTLTNRRFRGDLRRTVGEVVAGIQRYKWFESPSRVNHPQCRAVCQTQTEIPSDDIILGTARRRQESCPPKIN